MNKRTLLVSILLLLSTGVALAVGPNIVSYQGRVLTAGGTPVADGSYPAVFSFHNASTVGTLLWTESGSITTSAGLFTHKLGSISAISTSLFTANPDVWLEVTVNGELQTPRTQMTSLGNAIAVNTVDGASGGTITTKVSIGSGHINTGADAFVAGLNNTVSGPGSVVSGGINNIASGDYASIGGGGNNTAGYHSTVGGGQFNAATSNWGTVGGGKYDTASGSVATIGGGEGNKARADGSTVSGGRDNIATGIDATVGGGRDNIATEIYATVGGGIGNNATGIEATVGGGRSDTASGWRATVAGGYKNNASGSGASCGGGSSNTAAGAHSTVGGGVLNIVASSGGSATIGGGTSNSASGSSSTIAGGAGNSVPGNLCGTVGGGQNDTASGLFATVPGGRGNRAGGSYSFAAGRRAKAMGFGAFVWADSVDLDFASTADCQFLIRASGGVGIGTNAPAHPLHMASGAHVTTGGVWTTASSRELKFDIEPLKADEYTDFLSKLEDMEVVHFKYKSEPGVDHIGMIAEEVPSEIASPDRKGIPTADAIAFLVAAVKAQQSQIKELQASVKELKKDK